MNIYEREAYGTRIKELRVRMKLTQSDVAEALGVTPGYISNVENNRTAMSLRVLIYFAQLTHMSLDSLIGQLEPAYTAAAVDNELFEIIASLDSSQKKKLLDTLRIWL